MELLLVILVIAVIAGLSVPQFRGTFSRLTLRNAVSDLAYTMRYAQSRALMRNALHRIIFTDEFRKYKILEASGDDGFSALPGRMGNIVSLAHGITLDAENETIDFYPDGAIQSETLRLCQKQQCYTVSTALQRGRVSVVQDDNDSP